MHATLLSSRLSSPVIRGGERNEHMGKFAIVATIKTAPGKREEYLKHLKAHAQRCLATEPGTLKFEILVPQEEADTVMLYEVYASPEAFEGHWTGPSKQQANRDWGGTLIAERPRTQRAANFSASWPLI
jgi:quinol monooxygenase YgiN